MFHNSARMDLLSLRNAQETAFLRLLKVGMVLAKEYSALLILIDEQYIDLRPCPYITPEVTQDVSRKRTSADPGKRS